MVSGHVIGVNSTLLGVQKRESDEANKHQIYHSYLLRFSNIYFFKFKNMLPAPKSKKNKKKEKSGAKTTMSLDEFVDREYQVVEDENGVLHKMPIV